MSFSISCFVKYDHLDYQSERTRHIKNACFGMQRTHASASEGQILSKKLDSLPGRGSRLEIHELGSWEEEIGHATILYTDKSGLILIKDKLGDCHTLQRTQGSQ
jgi:hypothetical protein